MASDQWPVTSESRSVAGGCREEDDVAAIAGGEVKRLRRVVDLFQEAHGVQRRLGQNDDVNLLQPRQAADQVAALGAI